MYADDIALWCGHQTKWLYILNLKWAGVPIENIEFKRTFPLQSYPLVLTLKEPGFLDPSHSRGEGRIPPPLRSRKPIDETSSVWY